MCVCVYEKVVTRLRIDFFFCCFFSSSRFFYIFFPSRATTHIYTRVRADDTRAFINVVSTILSLSLQTYMRQSTRVVLLFLTGRQKNCIYNVYTTFRIIRFLFPAPPRPYAIINRHYYSHADFYLNTFYYIYPHQTDKTSYKNTYYYLYIDGYNVRIVVNVTFFAIVFYLCFGLCYVKAEWPIYCRALLYIQNISVRLLFSINY